MQVCIMCNIAPQKIEVLESLRRHAGILKRSPDPMIRLAAAAMENEMRERILEIQESLPQVNAPRIDSHEAPSIYSMPDHPSS